MKDINVKSNCGGLVSQTGLGQAKQSFGLYGRGLGWDDLGEWHWNMYIIICEMNLQSKLNAGYRMLGADALGWPRGMGWGGGGRGVQDGEHMYMHGGSMSMYDKTNTVL